MIRHRGSVRCEPRSRPMRARAPSPARPWRDRGRSPRWGQIPGRLSVAAEASCDWRRAGRGESQPSHSDRANFVRLFEYAWRPRERPSRDVSSAKVVRAWLGLLAARPGRPRVGSAQVCRVTAGADAAGPRARLCVSEVAQVRHLLVLSTNRTKRSQSRGPPGAPGGSDGSQ